jgi:hypothetical protein
MAKKQLKVALDDPLRQRLDAASAKAGHSLGTEIRYRLERSFASEQFDVATKLLMHHIGRLSVLTLQQTGRHWLGHAGAHAVFRRAIELLLNRRRPEGKAELDPAELPPDRPVAVTTDLEAAAAGLEAIVSIDPLTAEEMQHAKRALRAHGNALAELASAPRSRPRKPKPEGGHE